MQYSNYSMHHFNHILKYLAPLGEDVFASSDKIRGVKAGFELGRHEFTLSRQTMTILHVRHWVVLSKKVTELIETCVDLVMKNRFMKR